MYQYLHNMRVQLNFFKITLNKNYKTNSLNISIFNLLITVDVK